MNKLFMEKLAVNNRCVFIVDLFSLGNCICRSKKFIYSIYHNVSSPFASRLTPTYSLASRLASGAACSVSNIILPRSNSQVGKSVVVRNAVDMVNLADGGCAVHVKPHKPMREILDIINSDVYISVFGNASSNLPYPSPSGRGFYPSKNTCFWIVIQDFFKTLLRNGHAQLRKLPVYAVSGGLHGRGVQSLNLAGQCGV